MSFQKDTHFYERKRNHMASRNYFFLHTLVGPRLSVIAYIHLEDPIEISDITPIRCQNLPDYMMEGSEGEACKKCISLLDQLNQKQWLRHQGTIGSNLKCCC